MLRSGRNFAALLKPRYSAVFPEGESKTLQSQAADADINVIVKRFGITGGMPQVTVPPTVAEFEDVFDYMSAMNVIVAAKQSFMDLDADVRARFGNDPARYVAFCDERNEDGTLSNLAEMRKMKLALPEVVPVPEVIQKVEVVNAKSESGDGGAAK